MLKEDRFQAIFLLNASAEYAVQSNPSGTGSSVLFVEGRNLLDTNYETGGILAENEVEEVLEEVGLLLHLANHLLVFGGSHIRW